MGYNFRAHNSSSTFDMQEVIEGGTCSARIVHKDVQSGFLFQYDTGKLPHRLQQTQVKFSHHNVFISCLLLHLSCSCCGCLSIAACQDDSCISPGKIDRCVVTDT